MEETKPTYQEIESELNEYKELLWQLSDEYKENVTAAEKKAEEEVNKCLLLENKLKEQKTEKGSTYVNSLGLPACVLDNDGNIVHFNNKFKFLIELLFLDIEETKTIQKLIAKDESIDLLKGLTEYLKGDKSLYQSIYTLKSSFQGVIKLVLRIYRNENDNEHLALFVELNKQELDLIKTGEISWPVSNTEDTNAQETEIKEKNDELLLNIRSFVGRFEISEQLLNFINKKINDKTENISLIREIYNKIEKVFSLKKEAKDLLKSLNSEHKNFINRLKIQYGTLTANEVKQCMLIKAGLTYKEIAALMDISVNGVKIARNRLRKKLKLDSDTKTSDFIMKI